jgi:hypothetical protein
LHSSRDCHHDNGTTELLILSKIAHAYAESHTAFPGQSSKVSNVDQLSAVHGAMMSMERALLLSLSGYLS